MANKNVFDNRDLIGYNKAITAEGGVFVMGANIQEENGQICEVFGHLLEKTGANVTDVAIACDIPRATLYNLQRRRGSSKADLRMLKKLADYFDEDISIFLGLREYKKPMKLSPNEKKLVENYRRLTDAAQSRIDGALDDAAGNPKNLRKRS